MVFVAAVSSVSASPWPRDSGHLFVSTRGDYFLGRADAPVAPAIEPQRFERFETNTYTEFGLTQSTTLGGKVVYGTSTFFDGVSTSSASGFSEIEGFVQRRVWHDTHGSLSVKLAGAAPTRFDNAGRPGLVSDGADLETRVLYGRNLMLSPFKIFAGAEAGYRRRFGDAADQVRIDGFIGVEPLRRALALLDVYSTISLRNEELGGADYDVVKIQPSLVWRFSNHLTLQAGVTHEFAGRNLITGDTYFISIWTGF